MVELVDTRDLKSLICIGVRVRVPLQLLANKKGENGMVYIIIGASVLAVTTLVRHLLKRSEQDARNLQSWDRR